MSKQKKWMVAGIVFAVILVAAIIGSLIGKSGEPSKKNYIGDTVTHEGVSITVTSVENTQKYGTATTSKNLVVIHFTVVNNTDDKISINPLYCEFKNGKTKFDCKGYDYNIYDIIPGATENLYMAYETIQKSTEADYIMSFGYSIFNMEVIHINLKYEDGHIEDAPTDSVQYITGQVGDTLKYDGLEITVNSSEFKTSIYSSGYYYPGENNIWLVINATIKNTTNKTKSFSDAYYTKIIYKDSDGDEASYLGSYLLKSEFLEYHENILAYGQLTGIYAFKIPNTLPRDKGFYFQFSINKTSATQKVRVAL